MNARERFLGIALHQKTDRGFFWPDRFWNDTLQRWKREGMPHDYDFNYDIDEYKCDVCLVTGMNIGFEPPFREEILEDEGQYLILRDQYGIVKRVKKEGTSIPQFISFPVKDRQSWQDIKKRLDPKNQARYPRDWVEKIKKMSDYDGPITLGTGHLCGFFSFVRELCGDECYYLLYDDPDLIKDMMDFQVYRIITFIKKVTSYIRVDRLFIWEDMCYNRGPLISPEFFQKFLLEPYQKTIEVARQCGIGVIDVDSDGNVEELIHLWLEAGVNMLHPLEVAAGMDAVKIKNIYGERLAIRGGIDKREIAKDFAAIDREIDRIRPAYEMGGYIPHVDHAVPSDVSWDNYRYYLDGIMELIGEK